MNLGPRGLRGRRTGGRHHARPTGSGQRGECSRSSTRRQTGASRPPCPLDADPSARGFIRPGKSNGNPTSSAGHDIVSGYSRTRRTGPRSGVIGYTPEGLYDWETRHYLRSREVRVAATSPKPVHRRGAGQVHRRRPHVVCWPCREHLDRGRRQDAAGVLRGPGAAFMAASAGSSRATRTASREARPPQGQGAASSPAPSRSPRGPRRSPARHRSTTGRPARRARRHHHGRWPTRSPKVDAFALRMAKRAVNHTLDHLPGLQQPPSTRWFDMQPLRVITRAAVVNGGGSVPGRPLVG